jgi:hypothetical protein
MFLFLERASRGIGKRLVGNYVLDVTRVTLTLEDDIADYY